MRALALALSALFSLAAVACGPERVRENRTQGLELELRWIGADRSRTSYYEVSEAGEFGSSGGLRARDRAVDFRTRLDDADVARFVALVRATGFAGRARTSGETGDRSELLVIEDKRRVSFTVVGPDLAVDGLLAFLREISLRQFRDVIESQPQAGERLR
jgi:hypothetical protein